jgi:hypothetical protein
MAYLFPHRDWVGSAVALYLIDSGANVAVGLKLSPDCIRDCDEAGYHVVIGNKDKAGGKPIVIYLADDGDAMKVLLEWISLVPEISDLGREALSSFLFVFEKGGKLQPVSGSWFRNWFKREVSAIPYFAEREIQLVPSVLRPTILLKAVLDHNGSVRYAITLAQHTERVYGSYYERLPILLGHEYEERHSQQIVETIAVHRHKGGREFIGASEADFDRRLEEFEPTGFGLRCGNPYGHPKREGKLCETFDCWRCDKGIMVVDPEDVADLIAWDNVLTAEEGDWVRDHPDRWYEYYLGWQQYVDWVGKTMQQQPHLASVWDEGVLLAEASARVAHPIRPWS